MTTPRVKLATNECIDGVFDTFRDVVCIAHHKDGTIAFHVPYIVKAGTLLDDIMAFVAMKEDLIVGKEEIKEMVASQFKIFYQFP